MTLKYLVKRKIIYDVFRGTVTGNRKENGKLKWRVLVVDNLAMKIVSSCLKVHEVVEEGVTIIEKLHKKREPLPLLEAIYLLTPTKNSIDALIADFDAKLMYKTAHVFFTDACAQSLFDDLCKSRCAKHIQTLKEINLAFLPIESQVFSLDFSESFHLYFDPTNSSSSRIQNMERMAQQIATLCMTLGECPRIRYRSDFASNEMLAKMVQQNLDTCKLIEGRSELIILDRSFDCVSPLVHQLTFQAMTYDLLNIQNDAYEYKTDGGTRKVLLDENDDMWMKLRHEDIPFVTHYVNKSLKQFIDSKKDQNYEQTSLTRLRKLIATQPQHQKELNKIMAHLQLSEACIKIYEERVKNICQVEQDLMMRFNAGENLKRVSQVIMPILLGNVTEFEKVRFILLYIIFKNGITNDHLSKLIIHANIEEETQVIYNMAHLGINIIDEPANCTTPLIQNKLELKTMNRFQRKDRKSLLVGQMTGWTPVVQDIIEDTIKGILDKKEFPFVRTPSYCRPPDLSHSPRHSPLSRKRMSEVVKNVPKVIIFIVGGVTFSEMRVAYEVNKIYKNWEVIIGSTNTLIPDEFLRDLKSLTKYEH